MLMTETIREIVDAIRDSRTFLVTSHEGPDGDAIGASLGLAAFLRSIGKEVFVHLADPVPQLYSFLPGADLVINDIPDQSFDLAFALDLGEFRRAGSRFCEFGRISRTINVDHHLTCEKFGDINLIDENAAATGLLVWKIVSAFGSAVNHDIAICLYVAILTDTGSFRYSNSNREAFVAAGELLEQGGLNAWNVAEKLYENQPRIRLELLVRALPTLEFICGGKAASITVTLDMYDATGSSPEFTDGFVNYPRSVAGVEVAIFFRQLEEKKFKIGFRSKGAVNVALLAKAFGGGGHHNAAGGNLEGTLEDVKRIVYGAVESVPW